MNRAVIFLFALFFSAASPSTADTWEVIEEWPDSFAGEGVVAAQTINDDGFIFTIFRSNDGYVQAIYSLPPSSFDRLPKEGRVLMIRPGDYSSKEITVSPYPDNFNGMSNGISVRDRIWHGSDPQPMSGTLRNLLDSDVLSARFFLENGQTLDTNWSLSGSHPAIERALSIVAYVSPEDKAWAELVTETWILNTTRCRNEPVDGTACLDALEHCINIMKESRSRDQFTQCFRSRGY